MSVKITLPHKLEAALQVVAAARDLSIEEFALDVLRNVAQASYLSSPEAVVAEIRATPQADVPVTKGSLASALLSGAEDSDFDLEVWRREWSAAESEIKALSRADDLTEGRG